MKLKHTAIIAAAACGAILLATVPGTGKEDRYTSLISDVSAMRPAKMLRMADSCATLGKSDSAIILYTAAARLAADGKGEDDKELCVTARLKAGDIYYQRGDYSGALYSYVEGLKACDRSRSRRHLALLFKNIGKVYCVFDDYEKGYEYFRKGYGACRKHPDPDTERRLLINLTGLCLHTGKTAEAARWHAAAMRMDSVPDPEITFMAKLNQGMLWQAGGRRSKAIAQFKRLAAAEGRKAGAKYVCSAYQQTYMAYMDEGRADSALAYIGKCWDTARGAGLSHMFVETLEDYARLYAMKGDKERAQEYKARYLDMRDSIFDTHKFDMARNAQTRYEMQKAEDEIAELRYNQLAREQTILFQRVMLGAAAAGVAVVTAFLIITLRQKRRLRQSYTDLYSLNRRLMESRNELKAKQAGGEEGAGRKYKSSSLNDTGRRALATAITAVMEDSDEFCRADFSLERLAQLVGSNSKYVSQVINDTFSKNFRAYVNDYRVNLARHRLADSEHYGNYTTKAVGESLGFSSHASFINVFRNATGLTPSQYQKMSLQERRHAADTPENSIQKDS